MPQANPPAAPLSILDNGVPNFDSLPEVMRKLQVAAASLGADECYLFAFSSSGAGRLSPCPDVGFPAGSPVVEEIARGLSGALAEAATARATVLWWQGAEGKGPRLGGFAWCERIATPLSMPGIALPVCTERGQHGLVVFAGETIDADAAVLTEIHARCHGLFAVVAGLRPVEDGLSRRMSKRELECLKLTANGLTSEEIARALGLSVHTANQYLINTTQKLNAVNRVHAVAKALRAGLIG